MVLIATAGNTDLGLKRQNNEDAYYENAQKGCCIVADGMGGAAAGELASGIFINAASESLGPVENRTEAEAIALVQRAFHEANAKILLHVKDHSEHKGMGCTAEMMVFYSGGFVSGHVGDSRTYRFREKGLKQLTRDHSLVQDQLDQGLITPEEASAHPYRNVISRAVGTDEDLELDISRGATQSGDVFLLCSDGLTDMVADTVIENILRSEASLEGKVDRLIQAARESGGRDNITVALAHVL